MSGYAVLCQPALWRSPWRRCGLPVWTGAMGVPCGAPAPGHADGPYCAPRYVVCVTGSPSWAACGLAVAAWLRTADPAVPPAGLIPSRKHRVTPCPYGGGEITALIAAGGSMGRAAPAAAGSWSMARVRRLPARTCR